MFTVIMPTMWMGLEASIMLPLILDHLLAKEKSIRERVKNYKTIY